jgi:hypothetical protein
MPKPQGALEAPSLPRAKRQPRVHVPPPVEGTLLLAKASGPRWGERPSSPTIGTRCRMQTKRM